jgi:hypothetical protein
MVKGFNLSPHSSAIDDSLSHVVELPLQPSCARRGNSLSLHAPEPDSEV